MKKKIILIYPYFTCISGAYNRYLLLKELIQRRNIDFKFLVLNDKKYKFFLSKFAFKIFRFFKVEGLIFYYSIIQGYYIITDFNPSFIALFSDKVTIQIHDVSWQKKEFSRHFYFLYNFFSIFIKNYSRYLFYRLHRSINR